MSFRPRNTPLTATIRTMPVGGSGGYTTLSALKLHGVPKQLDRELVVLATTAAGLAGHPSDSHMASTRLWGRLTERLGIRLGVDRGAEIRPQASQDHPVHVVRTGPDIYDVSVQPNLAYIVTMKVELPTDKEAHHTLLVAGVVAHLANYGARGVEGVNTAELGGM